MAERNWIQTDRNNGWMTVLRLQIAMAAFFDQWQLTAIAPVQ